MMPNPAFFPACFACIEFAQTGLGHRRTGEDFGERPDATDIPAPGQEAAPSMPLVPRALAIAALLLAALFWGAGNVANKTLLDHIGPVTALSLRCAIATLLVLPFVRREGRLPTVGGWFNSALRLSALFAAALLFEQLAYVWTSVTNVGFLVNTCTVMTPILAWVFLRERVGPAVALAAGITVLGAFMMSGASVSVGGSVSGGFGDLLCLVSALAYAGWMVALGRHAMAFGRPFATMLVQFAVTAVFFLPTGFLIEAPTFAGIWAARAEILFLALFSTAGSFVLTAWAQRHVAASVAVVLVSAESLFGALGAALVLGERLSPAGLQGAVLILFAILLVAAPRACSGPRVHAR